jgi:hypothetical protein
MRSRPTRNDQTLELALGDCAVTPGKRESAPSIRPKSEPAAGKARADGICSDLATFAEFGEATRISRCRLSDPSAGEIDVPVYTNEFWTARQRQANSLHEVSYRACFKPQLPRFFIERLTNPGDTVYDPFMGRGTTLVEAALLGRIPFGNDVNPLSVVMTRPRLTPPTLAEVAERIGTIPLDAPGEMPEDLLAFYHPETLKAISSLKRHLMKKRESGRMDTLDEWIAMVALNRLTGHSNGFFSVYTLPPNQAVSVASQRKINDRRQQTPEPRDVPKLILKKTRQLLGDVRPEDTAALHRAGREAKLLTGLAAQTPDIPSASVDLVVTSPPFLDIVQYATDNWLRCWFLGYDAKAVKLTVPKVVAQWRSSMEEVLREVCRALKPGGHVAWEVGEVHKGATRLEEIVLPAGVVAGLDPALVLINDQEFTKTANCWGVDNMSKGTNTNRIVLFRKNK